jgi:predicted nucleic acid-binding protein
MRRVFLDTSALVKLYRTEPDSGAVQACLDPDDELLICDLTPLEFESACFSWVRRNLVNEQDARLRIQAFAADLGNYTVVEITRATWNHAWNLLDQFAITEGLRPPDSLQLASALEEHSQNPIDVFVTTDMVLAKVARINGLTVVP